LSTRNPGQWPIRRRGRAGRKKTENRPRAL